MPDVYTMLLIPMEKLLGKKRAPTIVTPFDLSIENVV
jgi:hypothetical protein